MTEYSLTSGDFVVRVSDGTWIPTDPLNSDYAEYVRWLKAGNTPNAYVPPPSPTPSEVSDRQLFQQLAVAGLISEKEALAAVKTGEAPAVLSSLVSSLPQSEQFSAQMLLSGATTFRRDHPIVEVFRVAVGMTAEQVDDLWRAAALL